MADSGVRINGCMNMGFVLPAYGERYGAIVGDDCTDSKDGGYVSICYFVPEYCNQPYGRTDGDSTLSIDATTEEYLRNPENLDLWFGDGSENMLSGDWELVDGELCLTRA